MTQTIHTQRGPFRLYYNADDDPGGQWSIDGGSKETERIVQSVKLSTGCSSVKTGLRPKADNVKDARAWIEGEGIVDFFDDGTANIRVLD